jgi:cob(I)alamin adenosyltransferase
MKKSPIYTKTGDKGSTGLLGGTRVCKNDIRLEAYGTMDELSAFLGLLRSYILDSSLEANIRRIQQYLFTMGAHLATDHQKINDSIDVSLLKKEIAWLEETIDMMDADLLPIHQFIVSGDNTVSSVCHVCRTVCRRLERRLYDTKCHFYIEEYVFVYFNRLSDFLFVFSRILSQK